MPTIGRPLDPELAQAHCGMARVSIARMPPKRPPQDLVARHDPRASGQPAPVVAGGSVLPTPVTRASTVRQISRACEVDRPLAPGDPRWLDLTPARGDRAAQKLLRRFQDKPIGEPLHMLFASHRGAGKSTELMLLQSHLKPRYHGLYLAANVQMDANQIEVEDLLLVLAQGIERHMHDLGKPLPTELLERVSHWFSQVIHTTSWGKDSSVETAGGIKAEAGLPMFAKITANLSSLFKVESKHREEVKNELKKFPGTLLESVNLLLDAAAQRLGPDCELLILIDNLDRYPPAVVDALLVRNGDRIRQLRCNMILTPPIGLLYRPHSEQIDTHFPCEVMNTVRLRRQDQPYDAFDGPGRDLLLQALDLRMDLASLLPDPRARDRLVTASGGAIRELLSLVVDAALSAEGASLTLGDVEYAVQRKKQRLRDLINANGWWGTLAAVGREKQIVSDAACLPVLYHRLVLKYNGEGWYDVLPLLTELPEFQHASQRLPPRL